MSTLNRFAGDERDWTAQYAAVGRFVVEFEWICWYLRFHAIAILQIHGLNKWPLGEIIFNQRVFTADPLFNCYASMVAECLGESHPLLSELDSVRSDFQKLSKVRNDLLHASYLIGGDIVEVTDRDQPSELCVEKRTPDKKGARVQILASTLKEMDEFIISAERLKAKVKDLVSKVIVTLHASTEQALGGDSP